MPHSLKRHLSEIINKENSMTEQYKYNVAVIGKTGVGKSSFINYLYGDKTCETGIGKPVTKNGFHAIETKIKGLPVTIFDSWGLEADKWKEWSADLDAELKKRSADKPASDWFHSVFYCIQAGGARIEPADEKIISKLLEQHYKISVVLTKADQLTEAEEAKLTSVIQQSFPSVSVLPVCSEGKKTRGGEVKPFGKEEVEIKAYADFFDSLIMRLPILCKSTLCKMRDECFREVSTYVSEVGFGGFNVNEIEEKISNRLQLLLNDLHEVGKKIVNDSLVMFHYFSFSLGYQPIKKSLKNDSDNLYLYNDSSVDLLSLFNRLLAGKKYVESNLRSEIQDAENKVNKYIDDLILDVELHLKRVKLQRLIGYSK